MERKTITAGFLSTICWLDTAVVDWASAGQLYSLDGKEKQLGKYHYGYNFDSSIVSSDGQYAFIYKKLETKGLLLKNGELLREINRSYYYADVYEYPAAFVTVNYKTYLVHCPLEYSRLDFEDVETGELITDIPGRKPSYVFHSRLEINAPNTFLMSKGWCWHPTDVVQVFNIDACINNPLLLDKSILSPNIDVEVCTASFINDSKIMIGTSDEAYDDENLNLPLKHVGIWDIGLNEVTNFVKIKGEFGNLYPINDKFSWDTFKFPKIINLDNGEIVDKDESIYSGEQNSSMIGHDSLKYPQIVFNKQTKQLAIKGDGKIEILTPSNVFLKAEMLRSQ
ncbi:hypothetical protein [Mucilaginibacter gotjawali]|uniref:Uncharacterized protein n=2 Tax=Mucilaginibacter gotjawali TaxID=1550579 RepID=A0A110B0L7_9SPHI|nr:hypothetical protein [Mucilaginibacter gotjawali]MBB3057976.1 hypothetical protein [Mucilaginibacter gotjawali]BAU52252.1 hypothetical protein MgSA37_00407 [Mucilaginibacter gotjawali]